VGIEESPFVNVNAGRFVDYLRTRWTNLDIGEIDTVNSPTINYIRLASYRRFSDVCNDLSALWPGSEFFIENNHTNGKVYFRQAVTADAPITLNQEYLNKIGKGDNQFVNIRKDYDKVANVVAYPYYREQFRAPDFHVQSTVSDPAFLKTTVILAGQPSSVEESILFFDDFGNENDNFLEYDTTNPSPPTGHNGAEGFIVRGEVNTVSGLHLLDAASVSSSTPRPVGRLTDPAALQPFTGQEGQTITASELVINQKGYGMVLGIVDQSTIQTFTTSGSSTTVINVIDTTGFTAGGLVDVGAETRKINSVTSTTITLASALVTAPAAGVTVELNRLSMTRVKFGTLFTPDGLTYIKDGVALTPEPWNYTVGETYSIRLFMQCYETTIATGSTPTSTSIQLTDASKFTTGDVVEIFTQGSMKAPERRVITKSGSTLTFAALSHVPSVGYRIRTLPKINLQIKGGTEFGSITGRAWTMLYQDPNTWQSSATVERASHGVAVAVHQLTYYPAQTSLVATLTQFAMRNPPPVIANIGTRYLHVGTQDVDSQDPDIDCLVRKVGSHYQLDFFPDTKALWASGTTLEIRYKERYRMQLESRNIQSITELARIRGYTIPVGANEQTLVRLGGRALDTIEISPAPVSDLDAITQAEAYLNAASQPAYTAEINTNTVIDMLCSPGQLLKSEFANTPSMIIQQVEIREIPGAKNEAGETIYFQRIKAGTLDRLKELLEKRTFIRGARLVLDDGRSDDSYTKIEKLGFTDTAVAVEIYTILQTPFFLLAEDGKYILTQDSAALTSPL
jgi:hypothetical protein